MITYNAVIITSWAVFLLVWVLTSFNVKRDVAGGGLIGLWQRYWVVRLALMALVVFVVTRLYTHSARLVGPAALNARELFAAPLALNWAGAALSVFGIGIAVWARLYLGRNWSSRPVAKEGHELVTTGPYAYVRHPIYTGVIMAALGTALTGTLFGVGVFFIATGIFLSRIPREERIMQELFPNEFPAYRARTKRLIPFVW